MNAFYKRHQHSARASPDDLLMGGRLEEELVVGARLLKVDEVFWLRSLYCAHKFRHKGYAKLLLVYLHDLSERGNIHQQWMTAQEHGQSASNPMMKASKDRILAIAEPALAPLYFAAGWEPMPKTHHSLPITLAKRVKNSALFTSYLDHRLPPQ